MLLRRWAVRLVLLRLLLRTTLIIGIRLLAAVRLRLFARWIGRLLVVVEVRLVAEIRLALSGLALRRLAWRRLSLPWLAVIALVAVEGLIANLARRRRRLVVGILRSELFLRRGDHAEIVFGVLEVIFRSDRVAGALGIARQLKILLGDVMSRSADLYLRAIQLINPRQRIVMVTASASATTLW